MATILHKLLCILLILTLCGECKELKFNLFTKLKGKGLEADQRILKKELESLGHQATTYNLNARRENVQRADVNIFFERLSPELFSMAKINWFIPNPEWFVNEMSALDHVDLILCRTREVERIFKELNRKTYFLGFTSEDCYRKEIEKDFTLFVHLPGSTNQKNTHSVLKLWEKNPDYPYLTIVRWNDQIQFDQPNLKIITHRLELAEFRALQNKAGIHLCPSLTEGWGHYIMEAMSAKAVVMTTNAPPMNEFITDENCLINFKYTIPFRLSTGYEVDLHDFDHKIRSLMNFSPKKLQAIGQKNRKRYLEIQHNFRMRLAELLQTI